MKNVDKTTEIPLALNKNEILVLCTCYSDGISYDGFQSLLEIIDNFQCSLKVGTTITDKNWNLENPISKNEGFHGLPWGEGSVSILSNHNKTKWLLVVVDTSCDFNYIYNDNNLIDKCKFKSGRIAYIGNRVEAIKLLQKHAPKDTPIVHVIQEDGHWSTQRAGSRSTQIAGHKSIQTANNESTQISSGEAIQTAGCKATQKAGFRSNQKAKYLSTQTAGYKSTQTAEAESIQTARDGSIQTAGNQSTQTAGSWSIQKAGYKSTQTAEAESIQTAGNLSTQITWNQSYQRAGIGSVQISRWWDKDCEKTTCRIVTEEEADVWYYVENGIWTRKNPPQGTNNE